MVLVAVVSNAFRVLVRAGSIVSHVKKLMSRSRPHSYCRETRLECRFLTLDDKRLGCGSGVDPGAVDTIDYTSYTRAKISFNQIFDLTALVYFNTEYYYKIENRLQL